MTLDDQCAITIFIVGIIILPFLLLWKYEGLKFATRMMVFVWLNVIWFVLVAFIFFGF